MNLGREEKVFAEFDVTVSDADGNTVTPLAAAVALLPPFRAPAGSTLWTDVELTGGSISVLLAGPDADPAGALPVADRGAGLWVRVTDAPEVVTVLVEQITIT